MQLDFRDPFPAVRTCRIEYGIVAGHGVSISLLTVLNPFDRVTSRAV